MKGIFETWYNITMYTSTGILHYHTEPLIKLVVDIDVEIGKYYRSFIPKYIKFRVPKYPTHISAIRHEAPPRMELWGKYEGKCLDFEYDNYIYFDSRYIWLEAYCVELENIREELGLKRHRNVNYLNAPCFHITIANLKFDR